MTSQIRVTRRWFRPLVGAALLCTSIGSQAADDLGQRAANTLGQWIADQGNAALQQVSRELKKSLQDQIKPFLPALADEDDARRSCVASTGTRACIDVAGR